MKNALIVYGGWDGHDPVGLMNLFREILEKENFHVTASDTLESFKADLTVYDLIIPIWTMGEIDGVASANVVKAVESGVGIAGCHGGMCDAFRDDTLWQFVTGSQWVAHPGGRDVTYRVCMKRSSGSEIVSGINDFDITDEQYYIHVDPAVNVLATTVFCTDNGAHMANGCVEVPVVYTKMWGKGRVFYNSIGHNAETFNIPEARELMRRGFIWAARKES